MNDSPAMRQAAGKLDELFAGLETKEERLKLLKFETNLLKAIGLSDQLQQEKQDSKFLSALIQLGSAYASLDSATSSALGSKPLISSLNTLWQAQDTQEIENGANKLEAFFQDFDNSVDRLNLLKFGEHTFKLAQRFPEFVFIQLQQEFVPPPSSVDPIYQLYNIFPGQSPWFMQHYFEGNGEPVDLGVWGLLDEYRNTPQVIQGVERLRFEVVEDVNRYLTPANPIVNGEFEVQVNTTSTFFVMGKSTLKLKFTATLDTTREPQTTRFAGVPDFVSYPYNLRLEYSVSDRFDDVPDTANLIPDEPFDVPVLADPLRTLTLGGKIEFPGGTPYNLTASWTTEDIYWTSPPS